MGLDTSQWRLVAGQVSAASGRVGAASAADVRAAAAEIEAGASAGAPRLTGALAASYSTEITGSGSYRTMVARIGSDLDYAPFVEEGTSDTSPQPHLGPAFDRVLPSFEAAIGDSGGSVFGS